MAPSLCDIFNKHNFFYKIYFIFNYKYVYIYFRYSFSLGLTIQQLSCLLNMSGLLLDVIQLMTPEFDTTSYRRSYCNLQWMRKMLIFHKIVFSFVNLITHLPQCIHLWNIFHSFQTFPSWCCTLFTNMILYRKSISFFLTAE